MSGAEDIVLGAVSFGPARSCEDAMAQSIVNISRELEEAQAQIAVYEMERSILQRELDEAREDANYAEKESSRMRAALQRLADCDWVITPHDRMDAVRKIARDALEASK